MRVLSITLLLGSIALLALVAIANWGFADAGAADESVSGGLHQNQGDGAAIDSSSASILNPDLIQNLQQYRNRYLIIGLVVLAVAFILGLQAKGSEV